MSTTDTMDLRGLSEEIDSGGVDTGDVREPRLKEIEVRYTDPSGVYHNAIIISKIKSGEDRIKVAKMAARLSGGTPWDSLPPAGQIRIWSLAVVTVQVDEPPEWLLQWIQEDDNLLYALASELEVHETAYFRGYIGTGKDSAERGGLVVRPVSSTAYTKESYAPDIPKLRTGGSS